MELLIATISNISTVGDSPIIFVTAFLTVIYLLIKRDWIKAVMTIASLGSAFYSMSLKGMFSQSRPISYTAENFIDWGSLFNWEIYSFPSTHTVVYTAFFGYLFYLSYKLKGFDKVLRHIIRAAAAVLIVFVGVSRLIIGAHYAKDVIFGYLFGFIYLCVIVAIERFLEQKSEGKSPVHK